jgi:glycosyltransferase involved in cell wall biosynthesis
MKLIIGITAPQSVVLLQGQLRFFVNKGYTVYLLAPEDKKTIDFCIKEGATLVPISIKREISPLSDFWSLLQIIKILLKIRPDVVNFGTPKISLLGLIAAKIVGVKKRIYTCRGFRFEHEKGKMKTVLIAMEKMTVSSSHKVLCISQSVRNLGIFNNIFSQEKSVVIHKGSSNGVDLKLFDKRTLDQEKITEFKQKYNPDNKFIYGFLGRIVERKGFKELLEAFDRIYQMDKNISLLVVGKPYYDQIDKSIVDFADAHPGIDMIGLVDYEETPYYYSIMDIFVLPAYWEGFGNVLIQAAAIGLPIISTDVTGCKDAVSDQFNGELIQDKNVDLLTSTMLKFKNNVELRNKYSVNSIEWTKNFDPEIIWNGLNDLYLN